LKGWHHTRQDIKGNSYLSRFRPKRCNQVITISTFLAQEVRTRVDCEKPESFELCPDVWPDERLNVLSRTFPSPWPGVCGCIDPSSRDEVEISGASNACPLPTHEIHHSHWQRINMIRPSKYKFALTSAPKRFPNLKLT
jgi:hypothetical protein